MEERESVKEFLDRLSKVVTQIMLLGEELSDQRVIEKLLSSSMHCKLQNKGGLKRSCASNNKDNTKLD
ncbi:hypothetical protein CR513_09838, partial [Mucuna pruriens]